MWRILRTRWEETTQQLATAEEFFSAVRSASALDREQDRFFRATYLMGLVSHLEAYLSDTTTEALAAFPEKLSASKLDVETLANATSVTALLRDLAERRVLSMAQQTFATGAPEMLAVFSKRLALDADLLDAVNEVKCMRDLLVHANGVANDRYVLKAGTRARYRKGDRVRLSDDYLRASRESIAALVLQFHESGPTVMSEYTEVRAFREMWEASALERVVPFDRAWDTGGGKTAYPKDLDHGWSHSERALYDFFLAIFNPNDPRRTNDVFEALRSWPPPYREHAIIRSWMEAPFWF